MIFKRAIMNFMSQDYEFNHIDKLLGQICTKQMSILDVGCGYGRILNPLSSKGFNITGVDANQDIVNFHQNADRKCLHISEINAQDQSYDLIIMSHIIEHFEPQELYDFMHSYLKFLKPNGRLLIATPLQSPYFYDDFDHKKPYPPESILMTFGKPSSQLKFKSENMLNLETLWFRKSPYFIGKRASLYFKSSLSTYAIVGLNFGLQLLFQITGKLLGRRDGWVGVFTKLPAT